MSLLRGPASPRSGTFAALALALLFLAGHLPFLTVSLDDIDSTNFALGLRDFDVAKHRPHPPGSPVFIALGKTSLALVEQGAGADVDAAGREALALVLLGVLCGGLAVFPLFRFFRGLELSDRRAIAACMVTLASPLYWFTAGRPMSDIAGLAAALVPLALLVMALERMGEAPATTSSFDSTDRLIVAGSLTAALSVGVRSQNLWLTLPLLLMVCVLRFRTGRRMAIAAATAAFAVGVIAWLVPLLIASDGAARYVKVLTEQGQEDWTGVELLATQMSARLLVSAFLNTLVAPWASPVLAVAILALAIPGIVVMWQRSRTGLAVLALVVGPYALFHLLFQEVVTTRYALPLVPVISYLAVRGVDALWSRAVPIAGVTLAVISLAVAAPGAVSYAREGSPVMRAMRDVKKRAANTRPPGAVMAMHHAFSLSLRGDPLPFPQLPSPPMHESMAITRHWMSGDDRPVWFLADPRRTDLALVDPASRHVLGRYRWPFASERFLSGVRPNEVDWYQINAPGWFVTQGWALTPELAGAADEDGSGPQIAPVTAYLRRREEAAVLIIGGRHVGPANTGSAKISLTLDGRPLESWQAGPRGAFLRKFLLPAGALAGNGKYALLTVRAEGLDRSGTPPVAIEQFDLQSADKVVFGYNTGWHELEYDPLLGRLWRWSSDKSELLVHHAGRDVRLRLVAEDPLVYFNNPPTIRVRAGDTVVATVTGDRTVDLTVAVSAAMLDRAEGRLTVETDQAFVPGELSARTSDRRRLGLRCFLVDVSAAGAPGTAASSPPAYRSGEPSAPPAQAVAPASH